MLRTEAVATIQRLLAFRVDLESEALDELRQAQAKFERQGIPLVSPWTGTFFPWFLLTEMAEVYVEAGEERIPLPADFVAESEGDGFWRFDASADRVWKPLAKLQTKQVRARDLTGTEPLAYSRSGKYFRLFPVSTVVVQFKTVYYAADAVLSEADEENLWLKHLPDLMIGEAGWKLAAALRDANAVQLFDRMRSEAAKGFFIANEAEEHVNVRYAMGGVED